MAAGADTNPGGEQLKHYWTKGEGVARWALSPHPWTTLRDHLLKYMNKGMADRCASEWFHIVFGYWSGSRKGANKFGPG